MAETINVGPGAFVAGDDHELDVTDPDISAAGQVASDAWFTVKHNPWDLDSGAIVQKHITPTDVHGVGCITNTGANGQAVTLRFDLVPADTNLLAASHMTPYLYYPYDIQIKTTAGKIYTSVNGLIVADTQVTLSTS